MQNSWLRDVQRVRQIAMERTGRDVLHEDKEKMLAIYYDVCETINTRTGKLGTTLNKIVHFRSRLCEQKKALGIVRISGCSTFRCVASAFGCVLK